jgi:hypothetical protein
VLSLPHAASSAASAIAMSGRVKRVCDVIVKDGMNEASMMVDDTCDET